MEYRCFMSSLSVDIRVTKIIMMKYEFVPDDYNPVITIILMLKPDLLEQTIVTQVVPRPLFNPSYTFYYILICLLV